MVAATLAAHASHLAQHWLERALAATPRRVAPVGAGVADPSAATALGIAPPGVDRDADVPAGPDPGHAELVMHALAASLRSSQAASRVFEAASARPPAGASTQPQDARPTGEVMRLGWAAGRMAFAAGLSLHHIVRDADLLLAVVLADVERVLGETPPAPGTTAAEAFTVARRLHRATGRYGQAAVSGFVHALLAELRERYRLLRHDLRNPLGTIRSALSLMEDETVPAEMRHGPNIRAMVARNAGSLDHLIGRGLDDAAATALLVPPQEVGLRDVALAARREVREAARLAGCEVMVDLPDLAPSRVDGAALELTLTAVLLAALSHAAPGATIRIAYADPHASPIGAAAGDGEMAEILQVGIEPPDHGVVEDSPAGATFWDEQGLRLAIELADDHGAHFGPDVTVARVHNADALMAALTATPTIYLRLPTLPDRPAAPPDRR